MTFCGFFEILGCLSLDTEAQCGFAMWVMVGDHYKQCVSYLSSDCNCSSHYTPDTNFEDVKYQSLCDQVSASTLSHTYTFNSGCLLYIFCFYFKVQNDTYSCCIIFSNFHKGRLDFDRNQGQCKR